MSYSTCVHRTLITEQVLQNRGGVMDLHLSEDTLVIVVTASVVLAGLAIPAISWAFVYALLSGQAGSAPWTGAGAGGVIGALVVAMQRGVRLVVELNDRRATRTQARRYLRHRPGVPPGCSRDAAGG